MVPIAFDLTLGGSSRLTVVPAGDETVFELASPWPHPSFDGAWLPVDRRVGAAGFEASWKVLHLGRNFPSSWVGAEIDRAPLPASAFGVSLLSPVDTYRTNERALTIGAFLAALYAFLFVLLQIQDYALLVGSIGLFVVLAAVMWFTRRVDWYRLGAAPPSQT